MKYVKGYQCQIPGLSNLLMEKFGYITDGAFVEVGAFDGYNWSNTWGLARAGWRGLLVEPNPEFHEQCVKRHADNPQIVVERCCIGREKADEVKLFLGGSISTTVPERVGLYSELDSFSFVGMALDDYILCPMKTLDTLLEEHEWPEGFEVLVVDVEGAEPDVFAGFNLGRWMPRMAIVELHEMFPDERLCANAEGVGNLFAENGYEKVYADHINTIFWCAK